MPASGVIGQNLVRLLLMRHEEQAREAGEHVPLTRAGRWQAETLGFTLDSWFRPEAILCSRSTRAREHADIVPGLLVQVSQ
jgi:phosphohistidine phosphatase SixA